MALVSSELFQDLRPNALTGNGMIGTRNFQVIATAGELLDPANIINNGSIFPRLPVRNDTYSFNGYPLQVVGFAVKSTVSPGCVQVEITYDDYLLSRREEYGQVLFTEKYPIYVPEPYVSTVAPGSSPSLITRAVPRTIDFETSQGQIVLTIPVFKWTSLERKQVRAQIGKLHKIGDEVCRFVSGNSTYLTFDRYEVTYRWVVDPGFAGSKVQLNPIFTRPKTDNGDGPDGRMDRKPFEKYLRTPSKINSIGEITTQPTINIIPAPEVVPIEFVTLPAPYEGYILFPN